jgi:hypothetical protein
LIGILETIKQQELNKLETFKNPDGKQVWLQKWRPTRRKFRFNHAIEQIVVW